MNIITHGFTHELVKTADTSSYTEYSVHRADALIGSITKAGAEILYTGRDTEGNIRATGKTLREALDNLILDMFYTLTFKGEKHIKTVGAWTEGAEVAVEYVKNDYVKHAKRVIRYDKAAGDLYIVIDNNKYFYHEFN